MVDANGEQLGVVTKDEALERAKENGLDLVLVAPTANPPVAKIVSFAKFKYQQQQKDKLSKKKTKTGEIKEVRFTPFIAEGDFQVRIRKAREFLEDGNKVKLNVKFVGRQITRKQFGVDLIQRAIEALTDLATIEREPAFQGKVLSAQLQPKK